MLGDVSSCLPKIKDKVDTIIVDPPRAGLDKVTKETIIEFNPNKIIYVSCDPSTLARDLKYLASTYSIESVTPFDMFPQTYHVETVVNLKLK
jgi:23S rRNA (uracil1939-C5)-methyltransferase